MTESTIEACMNLLKEKAALVAEVVAVATFFATVFFIIGLMAIGVIR